MTRHSPILALAALLSLSACDSDDGTGPRGGLDGGPPYVVLNASAYQGAAPLAVTLSVQSTETSAYTVDHIEWDFDGDRIYEERSAPAGGSAVDTGAPIASIAHVYDRAGTYHPVAKVVFHENEAAAFGYFRGRYVGGRRVEDSIRVAERAYQSMR